MMVMMVTVMVMKMVVMVIKAPTDPYGQSLIYCFSTSLGAQSSCLPSSCSYSPDIPTKASLWRLTVTQSMHDAIRATAAKLLQSCPTLCDPTDGSPPGSPVPGILQARTLEWVAISFSNAWKWKLKWSCSVLSDSLRPHGLQPTRLLHLWDFPGKSTGVGCHCLLWYRRAGVANFALQIRKLKLCAVKRTVQGHRTLWTQSWEASWEVIAAPGRG